MNPKRDIGAACTARNAARFQPLRRGTALEPAPMRIVAIGGGTGLPAVLRGLADTLHGHSAAGDAVTALVTVTDDGGSSGRLRRELGILPPGDIRNCVLALAQAPDEAFSALLQHRFDSDSPYAGHAFGNLLIAALTQVTGDFALAVEALEQIVNVKGRVLPITLENVHLAAEFHEGGSAIGETSIVSAGKRIRRLSLERPVRPLPDALRAIVNADAIVVGPGSLYTSLLPNLLVGGVAPTISGVGAVRIYVANLMTEPGETDGYTLEDHLEAIRAHVGCNLFDYVLVNDSPLTPEVEARYAQEGSVPVRQKWARSECAGAAIVRRPLATGVEDGWLRHHPAALAAAILELTRGGRPETARGWQTGTRSRS
jgi:uncharacterized cofD-like protein